MRKFILTLALAMAMLAVNAKTLIVYYSWTNNVHTIVNELQSQIDADAVRIEPAQDGLDYAADNYALGSALISAIRADPDNPESYPSVKPVDVDFAEYDMVIVAAPLWWGNMAAPLQTFLFHNGMRMSGKKIGLIVSSASSSISGVEADARRLVPDGDFLTPSLWIRSSQTPDCRSMLSRWLSDINYDGLTNEMASVAADRALDMSVTHGAIQVHGDFDTMSLFTLSGAKVLESPYSPACTSALAPGVYVAQVSAGCTSVVRKVILPK